MKRRPVSIPPMSSKAIMPPGNFICRVSLGDAESLAQHPASMTHSTYTPEQRAAHGISEGLVRLSVGLEDIADLLADVQQALAKCSRTLTRPSKLVSF